MLAGVELGRYLSSFFVIANTTEDPNQFTRGVRGPKVFGNLLLVAGNHRTRCTDDGTSRTVILFQANHLNLRKVLVNIENIIDDSPSESINTLGIIAYQA